MKAIRIDKFVKVSPICAFFKNCQLIWIQHLYEIKASEVPKPEAKSGKVIARIAAASVNFVDI
jgi:hypothetical protein